MKRVVTVVVPKSLAPSGSGGVVGFRVVLEGSDLDHCRCACRIENIPEGAGCKLSAPFRAGVAPLSLPGDYSGVATCFVEAYDRHLNQQYVGWFDIEAQRSLRTTDQIRIDTGGGNIQGPGIHYQPIEIHVHAPEGATARVVGEETRLTLPLRAEAGDEGIALQRLLEREEALILAREGNDVTALQLALGRRIVLGRCYAGQLEGAALERFEKLGSQRVHWVTTWDDTREVNRISATFQHLPGPQERLRIENLTDCTRLRQPLQIATGAETLAVEPGSQVSTPVTQDQVVAVCVGSGSNRKELVRMRYQSVEVGGLQVPVYRTTDFSFRWPPRDPTGLTVRHLGVWIPWELEELQRRLSDEAGSRLTIHFRVEDVRLWLWYSRSRQLVLIASNRNLHAALEES